MSDDKYDRLKRIPNWIQEKLANAKVAVFGCGALGNEVLKNLALLGVGHIWVVDYDTIEIHNLTRSVLFRESDIGRYKAEVVAQRVKELNPDTQVYPIIGKLEFAFGRGLLREMDVAFGCLDSIGARRELNERCYFAGVPWIDGGIGHDSGNVALFDPRVPDTACYQCAMDNFAWEKLYEKYSCPRSYLQDSYEEAKIATTIMTASVTAAYQVEVAVQLLIREDSNLQPGQQLFLPVTIPKGFDTTQLNVKGKCRIHASLLKKQEREIHRVRLDNTPRQVAAKIGLGNDWELELLFDYVFKFTCSCGYVETVRKPKKEIKQSEAKCPQCQNNRRAAVEGFRITSQSEEADCSFFDLRLCEREILQYVNDKGRVYIEIESEERETASESLSFFKNGVFSKNEEYITVTICERNQNLIKAADVPITMTFGAFKASAKEVFNMPANIPICLRLKRSGTDVNNEDTFQSAGIQDYDEFEIALSNDGC
jgi:molybdopterin/thiamine biosynthesis adenylyltransferase